MLSKNHPAVVEIFLAAAVLGAVIVPLNPRSAAKDIAFQITDGDIGFALVHRDVEPLARDGRLLNGTTWFCGDHWDRVVRVSDPYRGDRGCADDVVLQLYTSGTTGRPKGCLLTQRGWLSNISAWAHATHASNDDVVWPLLPLFHVAGLHFMLTTLATGGTYVVDGPCPPERFWEVVRARSVTVTSLYPNATALVDHPDSTASSATLRFAIANGDAEDLARALPHVLLATTYGSTELGGMSLLAVGEDHRRGNAVLGRPLVGIGVAVLDEDDHPVPTGSTGELCFRTPAATIGYWNLPDESTALVENGWLHTGDLGRVDDDGVFFFVDRKKDMVKPGGENVYSIEVETTLCAHPDVAECAVIGVPDDRWGEAVKAVVVARAPVTAQDLDRWCIERMAGYKRPRWYEFADRLPRNATTKVVKTELRRTHDPNTSVRLPERS
ncbi:hypothetical protein AU194_20910 [Mycobacterium sp. GA-2829]|nr:hypothetical protein AU194_20910 [Mycobacterium sp. GA-2829]